MSSVMLHSLFVTDATAMAKNAFIRSRKEADLTKLLLHADGYGYNKKLSVHSKSRVRMMEAVN
jgi:hypothetical protein